ncbi:MAG: hypothetical protein EOO73_16110 [Myxococcales bacterium]|nr:MAG: hypothetical protein EOO73_16110 [Myxococcales bacterium]
MAATPSKVLGGALAALCFLALDPARAEDGPNQRFGAPIGLVGKEQTGSRRAASPPAPDADGDGVPDRTDACPKVRGAVSNDAEANGCPLEADSDADGVPDQKDACPQEPGIKSSDPKTSGCAARADAGQVKGSAEVTFIGYQILPGNRGTVFVELTDPVAVEVSRNGQVIEYTLVGAAVPLKNNRNPLILRDFNSSAVTARLAAGKKSVRLVITLRGQVSPSHRMVRRGKSAAFEVELPAPAPPTP